MRKPREQAVANPKLPDRTIGTVSVAGRNLIHVAWTRVGGEGEQELDDVAVKGNIDRCSQHTPPFYFSQVVHAMQNRTDHGSELGAINMVQPSGKLSIPCLGFLVATAVARIQDPTRTVLCVKAQELIS
jgi:hypothetical protein